MVGVRLSDGDRVSTDRVVVAAGPWSVELVASMGVDLPIAAQRAQILLVDPGRELGLIPVLSDLVTLQYIRPDGSASLLVGDSDHAQPEWADPDDYVDRADDGFVERVITKFAHRFPGLSAAALATSYAGCYDVTPDYNPVISPSPIEGMWICAGIQWPRVQDLPGGRRAGRRPGVNRGQPSSGHRSPRLPARAFCRR